MLFVTIINCALIIYVKYFKKLYDYIYHYIIQNLVYEMV